MATITPRLGLTLPDGTESVTRAGFNANWQAAEDKAALRSEVQEPFHLKAATYDAANNRLVLTIGPGLANFLGTLVSKAADTTYYVAAPVINTTYHLFIKSDGSFANRTAAAEQAGEVRIWQVAIGAALATITTTDVRGRLPGASARKVADDLAAHLVAADPHPVYATDADLVGHTGNTNNPHTVTAAQVGALASVEGVSNPGGNIDLVPGGSITIAGNDGANTITIGETHSIRVDNPHNTTALQTGALVSVEGVSNPGGNIDLVGVGVTIASDDAANTITLTVSAAGIGALLSVDGVSNAGGNIDLVAAGAIEITPNDATNTIIISEVHSNRTDNPHAVTAAQVGALLSVEGVSNAGGNIDLVPGGAITIVGNDATNTITISETHSVRVDNPHTVTAAQVGALASIDGVSNAGGNVDLVAGTNITITPDDAANTITVSVSGTVASAASATNADTVDLIHLRNNAGVAEWSTDNANWNKFGMNAAQVRAIARRY